MFNLNPSLYLTKNQWAQIKTHKSMFFIESFPPFTFFLLRLVCFLFHDAVPLGNPADQRPPHIAAEIEAKEVATHNRQDDGGSD
jgi:hypothetical protein